MYQYNYTASLCLKKVKSAVTDDEKNKIATKEISLREIFAEFKGSMLAHLQEEVWISVSFLFFIFYSLFFILFLLFTFSFFYFRSSYFCPSSQIF
jgi:hypothetical protein